MWLLIKKACFDDVTRVKILRLVMLNLKIHGVVVVLLQSLTQFFSPSTQKRMDCVGDYRSPRGMISSLIKNSMVSSSQSSTLLSSSSLSTPPLSSRRRLFCS